VELLRKEEKCITQRKKLKRKRKKEKKRSSMLGVAYMLSWESRRETNNRRYNAV